jgi:hypothetical protein
MQKEIDITNNDRQAVENTELHALMGEISDYLDQSPDRAVRHGSVLHYAVREASKPHLVQNPTNLKAETN